MGKTKDIREAVEAELNFDPLVDPAGITVRNLNGQVALNGTVPSYPQYLAAATAAQRAAATSAVAGLTGVRNIRNEVAVWDDADASDVTVHVQDALDRSALIPDDSDVVVDASGNTVTLAGHVRTWAEHDAAVGAAWMTKGVFEVHDDIYVTG